MLADLSLIFVGRNHFCCLLSTVYYNLLRCLRETIFCCLLETNFVVSRNYFSSLPETIFVVIFFCCQLEAICVTYPY